MRIKPLSCSVCKRGYWTQGQLSIHEKRHYSKGNPNPRTGWACPKCNVKHYNIYANVCPSCGLDFNSEEFNKIARNLGKQVR